MTAANNGYRSTESKYKGGAHEMYVTYDLEQKTRGGTHAVYPKVKRVYIAGDIKDWRTGAVEKRTGRKVHGVRIEYEQQRARYRRKTGASVSAAAQRFVQVVEVPPHARNVHFYRIGGDMPARYRQALQNVR